MDPIVTGFGIIGQGGSWTIIRGSHTQSIVQGGENIIHSDVITHVLTNSSELTLESDSFPFDPLKAETLMVAHLNEPFLASDGDIRLASIIESSSPNQSRIIYPGMNGDISSRDDVRITVRSDVGEADKLNSAVQRYSSNKWNAAPSQIVEGSPKSIFCEIIEESDSSEQMNLANSLGVQTPELVLLRHTPMQIDNVGEQKGDGVAIMITDQDGIWRPTLSDIKTAPTHGEIETISEKLAYRKFIKDLEFETSKVFERENIEERKNIKNISELDRSEERQVR